MDISTLNRKQVGIYGENLAGRYLQKRGYRIIARNIVRKTGEIDVIARKGNTLHFVEVKTVLCKEFPDEKSDTDTYDPSVNLHTAKIRRVARTGEWYAANIRWEGNLQVDAVLVWLRVRDAVARVSYFSQIL